MKSFSDIQNDIYKIGSKMGIEKTQLFLRTGPLGDGSPYLEINGGEFHFIFSERGCEFSRKITHDLDTLLYWYFENICSKISYEYEKKNRVDRQDFRKIAFKKKIELLSIGNPLWGIKAQDEIDRILINAPYDDSN